MLEPVVDLIDRDLIVLGPRFQLFTFADHTRRELGIEIC